MDIIHESGKAYDLGDIQLTLSRMNPFFNDYGEQSLPVTLPPTDRNRELLIYPDNMAGISKASQRINDPARGILHPLPSSHPVSEPENRDRDQLLPQYRSVLRKDQGCTVIHGL